MKTFTALMLALGMMTIRYFIFPLSLTPMQVIHLVLSLLFTTLCISLISYAFWVDSTTTRDAESTRLILLLMISSGMSFLLSMFSDKYCYVDIAYSALVKARLVRSRQPFNPTWRCMTITRLSMLPILCLFGVLFWRIYAM